MSVPATFDKWLDDADAEEVDYAQGISKINSLPASEFISTFLPAESPLLTFAGKDGTAFSISYFSSSDLSSSDFEFCFNLIETTSSEAYKKSVVGWKPKEKKEEMREKDMRYLIVKSKTIPLGFCSFMITTEDDYPVNYIYEIHLLPPARGTGIGAHLMRIVEDVAKQIGLAKVMLTVFTSNANAERFYRRIGYAEDEVSPPERRLRGGVVKRNSYVIMSKWV
ncbi:acyl-CoA N-acyltransferase [Aulographum hederae CBS 113979]|uniref:N-alpha-acetyltransferase 40 n=1 Tax=Aulographum hederae CBS 113979 TaxID=1176131 RepID=A0A6G1GNZ6_9PEZI|nr:acyl-CoA N-acyltransferase [Aulographum hederae CBS 113979]